MVHQKRYLKRITIESRILLLLEPHRDSKDLMTVEEVLTQAGMAKELRIRRNNVSRALSDLISRDLIIFRTKHIKGIQRRRRAYFLSENGFMEADHLKKEIEERFVVVKNLEGELVEWKLSRARKELSSLLHRDVSTFEIITNIMTPDGIIIEDLNKDGTAITRAPELRNFYGRKEEIEIALESLSRKVPLISVIGMAGLGKTTFASHLVRLSDFRTVWVDINGLMSPDLLLDEIDNGLERSTSTGSRGKEVYRRIKRISQKLSVSDSILVLDDVQRSTDDVMITIGVLRDLSRRSGWTLILLSRSRPPVYTSTEALAREDILELVLGGLDEDSSLEMLSGAGIDLESSRRIWYSTRGHPLAMNLCTINPDADPAEFKTSFENFLEENVLREMGIREMKTLEMLSVIEFPIDKHSAVNLKEIDERALDGLIDKLMVRSYPDGKVDLHDAVREGVRNRISGDREMELLKMARAYHRERSSDMDAVQYLLISIMLNDKDSFLDGVLENGEYLIGRGFHSLAIKVLEVDLSGIKGRKKVLIEILRHDAAQILGRPDEALSHLRNAARLSEIMTRKKKNADSLELSTMVLNRLAENAIRGVVRGDLVERLKKGLIMARSSGSIEQEARLLNNLGTAYMKMGELGLASGYYESALDVFREAGDKRGEAVTMLNSGRSYALRMELAKALRTYLECIKMTRVDEEHGMFSLACHRVAHLYRFVEDDVSALKFYSDAALGYCISGDMGRSLKIALDMVELDGHEYHLQRTVDRMIRVLNGSGWEYIRHRLGWEHQSRDSDLVLMKVLSRSLGRKPVTSQMIRSSVTDHDPVRLDLLRKILLRQDAPNRDFSMKVLDSLS